MLPNYPPTIHTFTIPILTPTNYTSTPLTPHLLPSTTHQYTLINPMFLTPNYLLHHTPFNTLSFLHPHPTNTPSSPLHTNPTHTHTLNHHLNTPFQNPEHTPNSPSPPPTTNYTHTPTLTSHPTNNTPSISLPAPLQKRGRHHGNADRDHLPQQPDQQALGREGSKYPGFLGTPPAARGLHHELRDIRTHGPQHGRPWVTGG